MLDFILAKTLMFFIEMTHYVGKKSSFSFIVAFYILISFGARVRWFLYSFRKPTWFAITIFAILVITIVIFNSITYLWRYIIYVVANIINAFIIFDILDIIADNNVLNIILLISEDIH